MIILLAIILMIFTIWNLFCFVICMEDESIIIYSQDDIILKIAKIYWWFIITLILGIFLYKCCYFFSKQIICKIKNNDYPVCINTKGEK